MVIEITTLIIVKILGTSLVIEKTTAINEQTTLNIIEPPMVIEITTSIIVKTLGTSLVIEKTTAINEETTLNIVKPLWSLK
jgi:hypothetical protein